MKTDRITYSQLRKLVLEGQAPAAPAAPQAAQAAPQQGGQQQSGQQAAADPQVQKEQGAIQKALSGLWEQIKKLFAGKPGGARSIAEVFKAIIEAGSMGEALTSIAELKKEKEAKAKEEQAQQTQQGDAQAAEAQPEQQQAAESYEVTDEDNVEEGLFDRFKAKAAAWGTGAKAAAQNVGNAVKSKVTGQQTDAPKNDVYGAMQTGKFSTLIQQYIGKIQDLQKKCQDYAGKTQDKAEQQKCQSMIADMSEFVKNGQEALDQTKDELKKSGYNRKEQGQNQQQGQGDEQKQGNAKKDGQQQGDADKKQDDNKKDEQKPEGDENKDAESDEGKQEVKENQKFTLTIGQLKRLVAECQVNEGLWDKVKGAAKGVAQAAKGVGTSVKQAATNAAQTAAGAAKELGQAKTWTTKVWTSADYADKLSRIIGELNADLKDCGWSAKRNPGLAKVITKIEQDANKIHGQGEHGTQSNLDKIKHAAGKMVGGVVASAAQAAAIGVLMAPLRKFMSPRWYAALVAFSTVMLKYFVKKLGDKDLDADKKEEQAAQAAVPAQATQPTSESVEVPHIVFEHAMREAMRAYKRGFFISEDTKLTLTIGQLRRLMNEDLAVDIGKNAALDAADSALFGGAPVVKASEKGVEAYLKNDGSVANKDELPPEANGIQPVGLNGAYRAEFENGVPTRFYVRMPQGDFVGIPDEDGSVAIFLQKNGDFIDIDDMDCSGILKMKIRGNFDLCQKSADAYVKNGFKMLKNATATLSGGKVTKISPKAAPAPAPAAPAPAAPTPSGGSKGIRLVQSPSAAPKIAPQTRSGVFMGDTDVSDDF